MSDDTRIILEHRQTTISNRSPLQHAFQAVWHPENSTRRASTADRRSHGSPDPAHSPGVLEHSGAPRVPSEPADELPQLVRSGTTLNQHSTNCWGRTTVDSPTSVNRTRWVRQRKHLPERTPFNVLLLTDLPTAHARAI